MEAVAGQLRWRHMTGRLGSHSSESLAFTMPCLTYRVYLTDESIEVELDAKLCAPLSDLTAKFVPNINSESESDPTSRLESPF